MNIFKRILVFVLVLAMCSQMAVPALAANSLGVTYSATIDKPEIIESKNDQTITVTIKTNKTVDLDSLYAQAGVPSGLELQDIKNEDIGLGDLYDVDSGIIAWFSSNAMPKSTDTIAVLTYKVPANTPAGEYVIDFEIIDITVDYGKTSWETGATVSTTLTIIECPHTNKTTTTVEATCIKDGSVTVVCDDCGETTFSDVLPATGEHKDSDEDKDHNCDTCDKEIEGHNEDTKEETTPATCTEEGKRETVTFCTECGEELGRVTIETLPKAHTWGEPSYSWAADNSSCTAARSCTVCDEGKEEENVTATAETKAPTCTEDGATTYTADFTAEWAEDQTKEVPGESATDHDWQLVDYTENADGTHTANYVCGNDASHIKSDPAEGHTYGDNGQCVCGAEKVYKVNIADTVNGKVEADATSAAEGEVVYLSATPDYENGYDLYSLTVTDAEGEDVEIWKDYSYQYFEMPASDVTVTAVFAKPYSLYVAGVQVFDINASDVLGDGKVSYDPISNVLTLDNATVQGAANDDINAHHGAGICYYGDGDTLKIELVGTNNVTALSSTSISPVGIYVASADLIIDGTGTLNVSAFAPERTDEYGRQERCGAIELAGTGSDLTIEDGVTVNASATTEGKDGIYNTAIKAESNIVIKGNVTAKALNADNTTVGLADFSVGIYSENGSITIDGGEVTAEADEGELACGIGIGYNDNAKIEIINGAVVSAKAAEAAFSNSSGIAVQGEGQVVISDSTVTAIGGEADGAVSHGIGSCGDIAITNSTVTATGGKAITTEDAVFGTSNGYSYGIGSEGKITISGGTVIATASEAFASFGIGALGEIAITGSAVITATGETYGVGSEETITIGGDVTGEFTGGVMAVGALKGVAHEEGDYEITVKDELADEASKLNSIPAADWVNYDYVKIGSHTCAPTVVEETKATCIAAGNKTYYTCECGKYFADAEGKTVIPNLDAWKAEGGGGYIPIDDTAHDYPGTPSGYSDNGDGTHTAYYVCGRNESHIKYDESENHTYKDGICVCKKKQTFTVTVYNEYGQADKITLSNTTATYGENYVTNVSSTVGTGLMVTLIKKVSEEMWTGGGYFAFDPETNTLTVDADFITEDILVEVIPYVTLTTYVNGGAVSEDWQLNYETDEDGKFTVEWYCGEESYLFTDWDETSDSFVDGANTIFVREGYTVTSYNTAADGTGTKYETGTEYTLTEDTTLYIQWKANEYTVNWKIDGEEKSETLPYGADIKAPEAPAKEGHNFTGWTDGTNTYQPDDVITTVPVDGITVELTSTWTAKTYAVKFYNGEELLEETNQVFDAAIKTPDAPVIEGHIFIGWFDADDKPMPEKVPAVENQAYYAKYEADTYTVTFTINGEEYKKADFEYGAVVTAPEYVVPEGHSFTTWTLPETMPAEDITLDAALTINKYTITWVIDGVETEEEVEYNVVPTAPEAAKADDETFTYTFKGWDKEIVAATEDATYTAVFTKTGWLITEEGAQYLVKDEVQKTGWVEIGDSWYYLDPETGYRAEGISRVPYPSDKIEGNTYAPSKEDIDYANKVNNDEDPDNDINFVDGTTGLFWFDENGVFKYDYTGHVPSEDTGSWAVNGLIAWHVGLVCDGTDYYYFLGDEVNGGNIMATGDIYISRNTTEREVAIGGVYTFGEDGKLCEHDGITDMGDGTKRYYEDAQLMQGLGLTKVGDDYIYVRSNGELVVDKEYWVPSNSYGIPEGLYEFDENGFMIIPEPEVLKNGVYSEDGKWIYYVDGARQYNAGLMILPKGTSWYDAEGNVVKTADGASYVYVRSNGQLATGTYWITNTNGAMATGKYEFDQYGLIQSQMNGIFYENGGLFFYKDNRIQYNAGLIRYSGTSSEGVLYENNWIYVRSNGQLATGTYWITNTNDEMASGKYEFDADGKMIVTQIADGIHTENGKLYYYRNGVKLVGTGLMELPDGSYVYVKTSGELATGTYWVTNTGDTGLSQGQYTFGDDGILHI